MARARIFSERSSKQTALQIESEVVEEETSKLGPNAATLRTVGHLGRTYEIGKRS